MAAINEMSLTDYLSNKSRSYKLKQIYVMFDVMSIDCDPWVLLGLKVSRAIII